MESEGRSDLQEVILRCSWLNGTELKCQRWLQFHYLTCFGICLKIWYWDRRVGNQKEKWKPWKHWCSTQTIFCYQVQLKTFPAIQHSWHWARLDGSWECQTSALPSLLRWSSFSLLPTPLGCNLISGNCVSHPCGPAINTNIQCLFNCPASALLEFPGPWSVGGTADEVRTRLWGLSCP